MKIYAINKLKMIHSSIIILNHICILVYNKKMTIKQTDYLVIYELIYDNEYFTTLFYLKHRYEYD